MAVKNWKQFSQLREQTTPVSNDTDVEQELEQRVEDLERTRTEVNQITTAATQINAQTDADAITTTVENLVNTYSNNRDSFVTLALSYLKTIADKKKIELRLAQYAEQVPELQTQIRSRLQQLDSEISELRSPAESELPS